MSDLLSMLVVFVLTCVGIAIGVWLYLIKKPKTDPVGIDSNLAGELGLNKRTSMQASDWGNALVNVVVGVFVGIAIDGMVQLLTTGLWPIAILISLLLLGMVLLSELVDGLVEKIFPSGIRPANKVKIKPKIKRRTPLPRLLSLPLGMVIGVILARLGVSTAILGLVG